MVESLVFFSENHLNAMNKVDSIKAMGILHHNNATVIVKGYLSTDTQNWTILPTLAFNQEPNADNIFSCSKSFSMLN